MPPAIIGPSNPNPNPMDRPNPLSKPHLVKQRRRGGAAISRSSKPPITGFNPFYMDSDSNSNQVEERIDSWNSLDSSVNVNSSGLFSGFGSRECSPQDPLPHLPGSLVFGVSSSKNAGAEKGEKLSSNSNLDDNFVFGADVQASKGIQMNSGPFVFGNSTLKLPENNLRNVGAKKENKPVFVFGSSENLNLHEKVQTWHPFNSTSGTGSKEDSSQHGPFVFGKKSKENISFHEHIPIYSQPKMANLRNSENETTRGKSDLSGDFNFGTSSSSANDKDETVNVIYLEEKLEKEVHIGSSFAAYEEKDENLINHSSGTKSESTTYQKEGTPIFAFGSSKVNCESEYVENKLPEKVKNLNLGIGKSNKESKQGMFMFGVNIKKSTVHTLDEKMKNMEIRKEKEESFTCSNFFFNSKENYSNILPDEIQKLHIGTAKQNSSKARYQRNARDKKGRNRPSKVRNSSGAHQTPVFVPAFTARASSSEKYEPVPVPEPVTVPGQVSGPEPIPVLGQIPVPEPVTVPGQVPVPELVTVPGQVPVPVPEPDSPVSYSPMECSPYPSNESPNENENEVEVELASATEQSEIKGENPNENENEKPKIEEKEEKDADRKVDSANEASGSFKGFAFNASNPINKEENEKEFTFSASNSAQDPAVLVRATYRRHFRRKNKYRGCAENLNSETCSSSFVQLGGSLTNKSTPSVLFGGTRQEASNVSKTTETETRKEAGTSSNKALETCEKWRNRGNQAYANGKLGKAEEYYTRGIECVPSEEASGRCSRALMLCYSNRAATRMALGRMREAFHDCLAASGFDTTFLKAQLRAANCLLALGQYDNAIHYYNHCFHSHNADSKILTEASQGLAKAQKMIEYVNKATELLKKNSSSEVARALDLISDALLIGTNSDNLVKMKAKALLLLRRYDESIELCEQSLDSAQKNSNLEIDPRLWRWCLVSKAYFYLGKLDDALELLKKHEQVQPISDRCGEYSVSAAIIEELLRLKGSGNEAYQAGRYNEAIESYSAALAYNGESCGFSAICLGNRAAAYQALGQVMDAIADCSLAVALHPNYAKAISRRATLYEMVRDYCQAANDLRRLISLLHKSLPNNNNGNDVELNRAQIRLSSMEEESRKRTPLNMYLILGIERSSSGADVKKAYRKAALRHHPDKAGQFLVRSETLDESVWSEITNEVHRDADHLFKIIGESYNILSDPTKRLEYEAEMEMKSVKRGYYNGMSTPKSPEEQNSKQQWRPWRSYKNRHHWSESYDPYW